METETQAIIYGNDNFHFAEIIPKTGGGFEFGKPVHLPGMRGFSMEVEQATKKIPADNITFIQIPGTKVREASGTFLTMPEKYALLVGYHKNENGMLTDTGRQKPHAIFFEETKASESDETKVLHILYHVTAGEPTIETETLDEEVEEREIEFTYTALESRFVKDDQGKNATYAHITRTEENKAFYDTFKDKVLLPNELEGE